MHDLPRSDATGNRILPPVVAFLLLLSIPVIFRNASSTIKNLEQLVIHASALSLSDSAWAGNCWIFDGIEPPLPGSIAFGTHDLYPFRLATARDVQTGDVLIRIISPLSIPSDENAMNRLNLHYTSFVQDTVVSVLIHQQDSESWPVYLFSIITDD